MKEARRVKHPTIHLPALIQVWVVGGAVSAGRHPDQMPQPPELVPLNAEGQFVAVWPPLSKAAPSRTVEEAHFGHLDS